MTMALEAGEGSVSRPGCFLPPGKDRVPIVQEAGWAPGPVWTGAENLAPTGNRSLDCPARSQSLYWLSYLAHIMTSWHRLIYSLYNPTLQLSLLTLHIHTPMGYTSFPIHLHTLQFQHLLLLVAALPFLVTVVYMMIFWWFIRVTGY